MLRQSSYWPTYQRAVAWFGEWGSWAIFIAGFSPIPHKVFTIAAGALSMALLPFTLASFIGRGARFFLVAGLMAWGGERMEAVLHRTIDRIRLDHGCLGRAGHWGFPVAVRRLRWRDCGASTRREANHPRNDTSEKRLVRLTLNGLAKLSASVLCLVEP